MLDTNRNRKPVRNFLLLPALLILGSTVTLAAPAASPTSSDTTFASKAAAGGMAEVKLGRLAEEKGTSDAVKTFGKRMVADHTKANDKLASVAGKDGVTLPTAISSEDQALFDRLSSLSGADFDRAYANAMIKDHETDIMDFRNEATNGTGDIKAFAQQTLPTLRSHLYAAKAMEKQVSASGN